MQRVLIIERDTEFIHAARSVLEQAGLEVEIALQGVTGVDIVTNRRIDLVLLGVENLDSPGPELLQRVQEARPGIPILAVAENAAKYRVLGGLSDRVAGYLDKPLDAQAFSLALERRLGIRSV